MFEKEFENILRKYADAIHDKKRFAGIIKDCFPDDVKNINLLLTAYNLGIAEDIEQQQRISQACQERTLLKWAMTAAEDVIREAIALYHSSCR